MYKIMTKLTIEDLSLKEKKVLLRADFNVPLDEALKIVDPTRIESTLPSIRYVLDHGGALILMSHLGRPKGKVDPKLSLAPIAKALATLIGKPVLLAPNCVGADVKKMANALKPGEVLLLENLRFHNAEEHPEEDPNFAKELASLGDLYVNDAFGSSHRKHTSTYMLPLLFPGKAAAGFLLEKEIHFLGEALIHPKRPFYALLGGAKISTKIGVIKALVKKADRLLIGGGMAYTFLKAQGISIGDSIVEDDFLPLAKEILKENSKKILLPIDIVAAKAKDAPPKVFELTEGIPPGFQGFDCGPRTIELFIHALREAQTVLWNGPFGVYEVEAFSKGTLALAQAIGKLKAITIAGGGDLLAAIRAAGVTGFTHLSTGGGAALEYIELGTLPGIEVLRGV